MGLAAARYVFPKVVVQVLNTRTSTVHLSRGVGVACNAWKADTPDEPAKGAELASGTER